MPRLGVLGRGLHRMRTLRKHLIDHVQEALPSIAVCDCGSLEHHDCVHVLREQRVPNIFCEPLVKAVYPLN